MDDLVEGRRFFTRHAINDVLQRQTSTDSLDVFHRSGTKQSLQNARDQIAHHPVAHLPQHARELAKDVHCLIVHDELRLLRDRRALGLHVQSELRRQLEHGVVGDRGGDLFVPFPLVTDVDQAVVDAHFEFVGRFVAASLVLVEFFQTLQG
jgi:hypothetical protein